MITVYAIGIAAFEAGCLLMIAIDAITGRSRNRKRRCWDRYHGDASASQMVRWLK